MPTTLSFDAQGQDIATDCKVNPTIKSGSSLNMDGTREDTFFGGTKLNLSFDYFRFENIPAAKVKCVDKTKHFVIKDYPLPVPKKFDPNAQIPTTVTIKNWQPVTQTFGKSGTITFTVKKIP